MMKIGRFIAQLFSLILHPLLIPFYSILLLFVCTNSGLTYFSLFFKILLVSFVTSFLAPTLFILILRQKRLHSTKDGGITKEETPDSKGLANEPNSIIEKGDFFLPHIIALLANIVLALFFYKNFFEASILALVTTPIIIILTSLITTFFWKTSAHMMAFGALVGAVLSVSFYVYKTNPFILFILLFILAGCLGVSRLTLSNHRPKEVYLSLILGGVLSYIWIPLLINFLK